MTQEPIRASKRQRDDSNDQSVAAIGLDGLRTRCTFLQDWFANYGGDELYEIEVKLKAASQQQFDYIKKRLDSFPQWTSKATTETTDLSHESNVRGMVRAGQQPIFMLKKRIDTMDVAGDRQQLLRFTVCTEESADPPPSADPLQVVRLKKRFSYNRKNEFIYDLTEVRSGPSVQEAKTAPVEYEVELEWCGQAGTDAFADAFASHAASVADGAPAGHATAAAALADKFLMKAQDLVDMANQAAAQIPAERNKRPALAAGAS